MSSGSARRRRASRRTRRCPARGSRSSARRRCPRGGPRGPPPRTRVRRGPPAGRPPRRRRRPGSPLRAPLAAPPVAACRVRRRRVRGCCPGAPGTPDSRRRCGTSTPSPEHDGADGFGVVDLPGFPDELAHLLVDVRRDDHRLVRLAGVRERRRERCERLPRPAGPSNSTSLPVSRASRSRPSPPAGCRTARASGRTACTRRVGRSRPR